jgi:hypothetical protein
MQKGKIFITEEQNKEKFSFKARDHFTKQKGKTFITEQQNKEKFSFKARDHFTNAKRKNFYHGTAEQREMNYPGSTHQLKYVDKEQSFSISNQRIFYIFLLLYISLNNGK